MAEPLDVCAAVVLNQRRLLLATRRPGSHLAGKWEFPGGKKEEHETLVDCIRRELKEELALDIERAFPLFHILHVYPEKTIRLHFMECIPTTDAAPCPTEGQLADWFSPTQFPLLDWVPADKRIILWLKDLHNSSLAGLTLIDPIRTEQLARTLFPA